jgi:bis(5'-nucleosyl)-tetraphosphatase (symmetrical)
MAQGAGAEAPGGTARRRVFVGDVQGCADELDDLLCALPFDPALHELWFVGDLVNRGPASARVLRRAIELGAGSVLGNHDLHLLGVARGERPLRVDDTFADVLDAPDREELLAWLARRPLLVAWDDLLLVHAGLHPGWDDPVAVARGLEARIAKGELPWDDDALRFLVGVRHCDASGSRPRDEERPGPGFAPWDRFYRGVRLVVCGHWAARGVACGERLRALDSGCVWGGRLTAWVAGEDRLVSVPARRVWQTPKRGPRPRVGVPAP